MRQRERLGGEGCNAVLPAKKLRDFCLLDDSGRALLAGAVSKLHLSARGHDRILRVARTIADLAGAQTVATTHLAEAIGYRGLDRSLLSA